MQGLTFSALTDYYLCVPEEPRVIEIASSPEGTEPFMYVVRWEKPRTGGLPINRYQFKYRPVSTPAVCSMLYKYHWTKIWWTLKVTKWKRRRYKTADFSPEDEDNLCDNKLVLMCRDTEFMKLSCRKKLAKLTLSFSSKSVLTTPTKTLPVWRLGPDFLPHQAGAGRCMISEMFSADGRIRWLRLSHWHGDGRSTQHSMLLGRFQCWIREGNWKPGWCDFEKRGPEQQGFYRGVWSCHGSFQVLPNRVQSVCVP